MLKSMTGYGSAIYADEELNVSVEAKTLNSKFLDMNLRLPKNFSDKEIDVRNLVTQKLERGKVGITVEYTNLTHNEPKQEYNAELFKKYYSQIKTLADKVNDEGHEVFRLAMAAPDVAINVQEDKIDEKEWAIIYNTITEALNQCNAFRLKEGAELQTKLADYIGEIEEGLVKVGALDPHRIERIKGRIKGNLQEFIEEEGLDENRLEQELVFYIEKLDITEEKVRLKSHLSHFSETLEAEDSLGKKLGFIAQEIGREINTIGSKANDAAIQKAVVSMKENLEKIKEQVLNVL